MDSAWVEGSRWCGLSLIICAIMVHLPWIWIQRYYIFVPNGGEVQVHVSYIYIHKYVNIYNICVYMCIYFYINTNATIEVCVCVKSSSIVVSSLACVYPFPTSIYFYCIYVHQSWETHTHITNIETQLSSTFNLHSGDSFLSICLSKHCECKDSNQGLEDNHNHKHFRS